MKRIGFTFLVASSVMLWAAVGVAQRPHYGGTLFVAMRASLTTLDPLNSDPVNWSGSRNIYSCLFDTLTSLDSEGKAQAVLAVSWQADSANLHWHFTLRPGVTFQDDTLLSPGIVAMSLLRNNPSWKIEATHDGVNVQCSDPCPDLPAELALPRNSIVKTDNGKTLGTGPFVVGQWEPGHKLVLIARDAYWRGRPFLDSIEIEMGKNLRDQMMSFDLAKTHVIEIAPEQARRAASANRNVETSPLGELVALVFRSDPQNAEEDKQRQILAESVDRDSLSDVVLQGGGRPSSALLPTWMTGYGFVFPAKRDLANAQQLRAEIPQSTPWTLGFDSNDSIAGILAERIVLNAADAGLRMQLGPGTTFDVRLVRVPLQSVDAHVALTELAASLGLPKPRFAGEAIDGTYSAEATFLQSHRIIPLLHLRTACLVSNHVRNWRSATDGSWPLSDVWLGAAKP